MVRENTYKRPFWKRENDHGYNKARRDEADDSTSSSRGSAESAEISVVAGRHIGRRSDSAEPESRVRAARLDKDPGRRGHPSEGSPTRKDSLSLGHWETGFRREPVSERRVIAKLLGLCALVGLIVSSMQGRDVLPIVYIIVGGLMGYYFPRPGS